MITMVLGGQYGSEGKGSVSSWLARYQEFDLAIRSGSPNAGHTFEHNGQLFKMRHLPCTWADQPFCDIYLSASTVINRKVLEEEIKLVRDNGFVGKIWVSPLAVVIDESDMEYERQISTGTTGEGVGATRARKCLRQAKLMKDYYPPVYPLFSQRDEVRSVLNNREKQLFIEGTQGYALSLDGSRYPYVTSTNLTTYRILDDCEIPYNVHFADVWMVLRTYPIRIAGNSGRLFNEISWEKLQERHGSHIPVEQTTVTKKTRRVGEWDLSLASEAYKRIRPNKVVLTFVDYIFPDVEKTGITPEIKHYLNHIKGGASIPVTHVGIGIGNIMPVS